MVVTTINKKITKLNRWEGGNTKKYIVIHDVGIKGQTALDNVTYFFNYYIGASAHYFVDRPSVWQSVLDDDRAWHVGDDPDDSDDGINNHNSIGIEMIVEADGTIHAETKANTRWLVKKLQKEYNIPDKNIVRHYDASGKNCPQYLNKDKKWTEWKEFYQYLIKKEETKQPVKTTSPSTSKAETYKVVKSISGYKTAADAKSKKNKATTVKADTYYVYKKSDGMYNVSSKKGVAGSWINPSENVAKTETVKTYKVVASIGGYTTADNAKNKKNKVTSMKKGTYYIYKEHNGMINISATKGVAGCWINPAENKVSTKVTHTVVWGDTLSVLAAKYSTTVAKIQELNNMGKSTLIKVGQVLIIKK